jgi:hypothetical protein
MSDSDVDLVITAVQTVVSQSSNQQALKVLSLSASM